MISAPKQRLKGPNHQAKSVAPMSTTQQPHNRKPLLAAAFVGSLPAFQMGYAIGVLQPLAGVASAALGCSAADVTGWPVIVGAFCPAGFAGTQLAPRLGLRGRRAALNVTAGLCLLGGILSAASVADRRRLPLLSLQPLPHQESGLSSGVDLFAEAEAAGALETQSSPGWTPPPFPSPFGFALLLLGRVLLGLAAGCGSVVVPTYLAEIAPHPAMRGQLGALFQLQVCLGVVVSQAGALWLGGCPERFLSLLLGGPAAVAALQLALQRPYLPESPPWLRLQGRRQEASRAAKRLAGDCTGGSGHGGYRGRRGRLERDPGEGGVDAEEEEDEEGEEGGGGEEGSLRASRGLTGLLLKGTKAGTSALAGTGLGAGRRLPPMGWSDLAPLELRAVAADPKLRRALCLVTLLLVAQQLSGIHAVFNYSSDVFAAAGLQCDPLHAALLASAVHAAAAVAVVPLVERQGRRRLLLWGTAGMAGSVLLLTAALALHQHAAADAQHAAAPAATPAASAAHAPPSPEAASLLRDGGGGGGGGSGGGFLAAGPAPGTAAVSSMALLGPGVGLSATAYPSHPGEAVTEALSVVVLGAWVTLGACFELGLGAVPWLVGSEMLPPHAKDAALAFAAAANWFANFLIGLCFPSIQQALGPYSFLPFIGVLAAAFAAVWLLLPETRGRHPSQVLELIYARSLSAGC